MKREGVSGASLPDVCMLVEGTYPYVIGGVSAWVHDIIVGNPDLDFSILNIGSHAGCYGEQRYVLPDNVGRLHQVYCQDVRPVPQSGRERSALEQQIRTARAQSENRALPSRVLAALRRLYLDEGVDVGLLADLASGDLSLGEFLHGQGTFDLLSELATRIAPDVSFLDLFWHFRGIHVPILRLLATPLVPARCYHAVSTGYAGLLAAAFSLKSGRPMLLTEHGIYSRERNIELARATWIKDQVDDPLGPPSSSPLRRIWSRSFHAMALLAYNQASRIITLSDVNRQRQIADGAPPSKISIVPNGVDVTAADPAPREPPLDGPPQRSERRPPLRVGFVGRVVPIKDLVTLIIACHQAMHSVELDVRIIGPTDEDPAYTLRCRDLIQTLGRQSSIRFLGPQPRHLIYPELDVVALTSFSEGQPLVMLEAYAAGVPVIATDVGACREMIEGRSPADRLIGASGIVTRVGTPNETAAALARVALDPGLRRRLGAAGRQRVSAFYGHRDMIESYRAVYREVAVAS